ncbi:hypothetical protein [Streptomyces specialis]|uniref:hypothetical protein n=1 Tax=Streptomyces specialis TaxID=498367 RepID=UPI00073ECFDD|nr:hypothetical protein [Streptomyces specialis]
MSLSIGPLDHVKLISDATDPVMHHKGHEVTDTSTGRTGVLKDVLVWEREGRRQVQVFLRRNGHEWDTEPDAICCSCGKALT